jgi:hypothetical protein
MKTIRGDKPSEVIIHSYMEISQGNSLCSYLYLKLKCFLFFFLWHQTTGGWNNPAQGWGLEPVGEGRCWRKDVGGWIQYNKMCTHASKCKNTWDYSSNKGRGRWRRMFERMNSCMIYLIHCNNLCKCHNVPPSSQH